MMNGFIFTLGNKELFLVSENKNIANVIVEKFIDKIGEINNCSVEIIERVKANSYDMRKIKSRIDHATLRKIKFESGKYYYSIKGKNFMLSIPQEDAECLIVFE